jgi:hypothetical protein
MKEIAPKILDDAKLKVLEQFTFRPRESLALALPERHSALNNLTH